jgi:hypothetical protein
MTPNAAMNAWIRHGAAGRHAEDDDEQAPPAGNAGNGTGSPPPAGAPDMNVFIRGLAGFLLAGKR